MKNQEIFSDKDSDFVVETDLGISSDNMTPL